MTFGEDWSAETVGSILKKTRESKHLTVNDVAEKTYLKVSFIKALEEDRFEDLPAKIHINGFVSLYAKYLELDANQILLKLRKQEILNQDTPVKEIMEISKDKRVFRRNYNPLFFIVISVIIALVVLFFFAIFHSSKAGIGNTILEKNNSVLTQANPQKQFSLKKGDLFQFSIDKNTFIYKVVDFSEQSIVLNYQAENKNVYVLSNEVLEHDYTGKYEYGYAIKKLKIENSMLLLNVALIKKPRTMEQNEMATFLISGADEDTIKDPIGSASFVNKGTIPVVLYLMDINNIEQEIDIKPYEKKTINLLKDKILFIKSISISNLSLLTIKVNQKDVNQVITKGAIGMLTITQANPLDPNSLNYSLDY